MLARALSALGDGAHVGDAARLAGLAHAELEAAMAALVSAGVVEPGGTIRFVHPVHLGDTITYTSQVAALAPRGADRGIADLEFEIRNQHGRVCVAGVIKILLNNTQPAS